MLEEINESICMKSDFLHRNYKIPMGLQKEVDNFFLCLEELGKECRDSAEFEKRYKEEGYEDMLHGLYLRCIPKPDVSEERKAEYPEDERPGFLESMAEEVSEADEKAAEEKDNGSEGFFGLFKKRHTK